MKPFDLEKALAGEPVMLRCGHKAFIKYNILDESNIAGFDCKSAPLQGYELSELGEVLSTTWQLDGTALLWDNNYDIIGMWEEIRPTVTLTLPCPLKEPQDTLYYFDGESVYSEKYIEGNEYQEKMLDCGLYFASEQDAQAWLDAMRSNRR